MDAFQSKIIKQMVDRTPSLRFETLYTVGLLWFSAGAVLDSNHHMHGSPADFFTPGHAIAYAAIIMLTGMLGYRAVNEIGDGKAPALPTGYRFGLLGCLLILTAGTGDMIWHELVGFEVRSSEQLSPTHLLLAIGAAAVVSSPLRRAWSGGIEAKWRDQFPMLTSSALLISVWTLLMFHAHPFVHPFAASWFSPADAAGPYWDVSQGSNVYITEVTTQLGIAGITLYIIGLLVVILILLSRFKIVSGGLTFIIGLNTVILVGSAGTQVFLPAGVGAGVFADTFHVLLLSQPFTDRLVNFRLFAFFLPVVLVVLYFTTLMQTGGISWPIHVWMGSIVLAGTIGTTVSYVVCPSPS